MSLAAAYRIIAGVWATGALISTLEFLSLRAAFGSAGVLPWRVVRLGLPPGPVPLIAGALNVMYGVGGVTVLLGCRALSLAVIIASALTGPPSVLGLAGAVVTTFLLSLRRGWGDDGSDQMSSLIAVTLFLCVGPFSDHLLAVTGLWFLALETCLAYLASGVAKLAGPLWRSGQAVPQIVNTATYGSRWAGETMKRHSLLGRLVSWSVVAAEVTFPLALVLPRPWCWAFLAWGAAFHLSAAIVMGLNSFFWAFVATYAAVVFVQPHVVAMVQHL